MFITNHFYLKFKKKISIILVTIFTSSLLSNYSYAMSKPQLHINIENKNRWTITDSFKGNKKRKIYCIQTLHCNKEINEKIYDIIKVLKSKYGKNLKFLFTEGTDGYIDTKILNKITPKKIRTEFINHLLEQGEITAGEFYALKNPDKISLYGLEDYDLYKTDFEFFCKAIEQSEKADQIITQIQNVIEFSKTILYPQKLIELEEKEQKYNNNKIDFKKFFKYLITTAEESKTKYKHYPNINFKLEMH
ncbi:hypothetical protein ACFL5N_00930, partial [bacterium]